MSVNFFIKSPDGVLDYDIYWGTWLAGDVIDSFEITAPAGITEGTHVASDDTVTIWAEDGTIGANYRFKCKVTTAAGRVETKSIIIGVRDT